MNGQIIKGVGGLYTVKTEEGQITCKPRGVFRNTKLTPTIGDYVRVAPETATIVEILPRKSLLPRPRVANVDQAIIVFAAASPPVNPDLMDRFLLLADYENVEPIVCVNKMDQAGPEDAGVAMALADCYEKSGYEVLRMSAAQGEGLAACAAKLAGKVSVFAGPSGVGKSSIINMILPRAQMETGELSRKINRGRHTTRHVELLEAFPGAFVVDSPGFTSLSLEQIPSSELASLFREFRPFLGQCRYTDCRHLNEPGCAVKAAAGEAVDSSRYQRYTVLLAEAMEREARLMEKGAKKR